MANELGDWSKLDEDLLCMIGQRLITLDDVIRSRAVCTPWRQTLEAEQQRRFPPSTHWLMLPYCTSNNMNMGALIGSTSSPDDVAMAIPMIGCKGSEGCRCFYDVALHQFHHIELPQHLRNKTCRGSAMGWLFMVGETPGISLFNPLTKTEIPLPPVTAFDDVLGYHPEKPRLEYLLADPTEIGFTLTLGKKAMVKRYIMRVAISADPTTKDCIVMAIRINSGYRLAFCRPAETEAGWIFVAHEEENGIPPRIPYADVVCWRDQFYVLDFDGNVLVCNFSANPHRPTLSYFFNLPPHLRFSAENSYLVISPAAVTGDDDDELMMVTRYANSFSMGSVHVDPPDDDDDDYNINAPDSDSDDEQLGTGAGGGIRAVAAKTYCTEKFEVFKLNKDRSGWDKVESIGDFALFLGLNTPGAFVSTKDHPGLLPNSIYFTDDLIDFYNNPNCKFEGYHDMGIYDLATDTIRPLYSTTSLHNNPFWISPLPIWLSPSSSSSSSSSSSNNY